MVNAADDKKISEEAKKNILEKEIRDIEEKILISAKNGSESISIYGNISDETAEELSRLGYEVTLLFEKKGKIVKGRVISWSNS